MADDGRRDGRARLAQDPFELSVRDGNRSTRPDGDDGHAASRVRAITLDAAASTPPRIRTAHGARPCHIRHRPQRRRGSPIPQRRRAPCAQTAKLPRYARMSLQPACQRGDAAGQRRFSRRKPRSRTAAPFAAVTARPSGCNPTKRHATSLTRGRPMNRFRAEEGPMNKDELKGKAENLKGRGEGGRRGADGRQAEGRRRASSIACAARCARRSARPSARPRATSRATKTTTNSSTAWRRELSFRDAVELVSAGRRRRRVRSGPTARRRRRRCSFGGADGGARPAAHRRARRAGEQRIARAVAVRPAGRAGRAGGRRRARAGGAARDRDGRRRSWRCRRRARRRPRTMPVAQASSSSTLVGVATGARRRRAPRRAADSRASSGRRRRRPAGRGQRLTDEPRRRTARSSGRRRDTAARARRVRRRGDG